MTLNIQAGLAAQTFALGEKVPLALAITNPGPEGGSAVDPRAGGRFLRFYVTVPGGGRRTFTMEEATAAPGVPPLVPKIQCPPEYRWDIEFDLSNLTPLNQPGMWSVMLEYEPEPGRKWTSAEMPFVILPPAGASLELAPDDSAFSAQRTLIWVEKVGGTGRVLAMPMERRIYAPAVLHSATEIGRSHADASPAASTSPANLPYPDRWIAWVNKRRLFAFYWSLEPGWRLQPVHTDLGFDPILIRPLLAGSPPDEGRSTCLVGMFWPGAAGSGLTAVELGADGTGRMLPAMNLEGIAQAAWATTPAPAARIFVLALAAGNRTDLVLVACPAGGGLQRPRTLFSAEGKFAAGDMRVMPDGKIGVGVIVQSGEEWKRITLRTPLIPMGGEPVVETILPGAGARPLCARLDAAGGLHWVYWREKIVHYMAPGASESSFLSQRLAQYGSHFNISLREGSPASALLYYDSERGPCFVRI